MKKTYFYYNFLDTLKVTALMEKLNDLESTKNETVDESSIFIPTTSAVVFQLIKQSTTDLAYLLLKYIDISGQKDIKVLKNKTKNFDAANSFKKKVSISLEKKESMIQNFFKGNKYFKTFPWRMSVMWLLFICMLFWYIFLSKGYIEKKVNDGFSKIVALKQWDLNLEQAEKSISDARFDFIIANFLFYPYRLVFSQDIQNASHIIYAGKNITDSLLDFITIYNESEKFISKKWINEVLYSQLIVNLKPYLEESEHNLSSTLYNLEKIENLWNKEIEEKIKEQIWFLKELKNTISLVNTNFETLLDIFWHSKEKSYLIVFQNSDEIRATWGFMWSMWILKIFRWQVKSFESKDVYAYEWNLKKSDHERLPPPEWINKLTDSFGLRDANYFINVWESSKNIKFFIENAGYKIDGVIYLNQNIALEFLDVLWGVKFNKIDEKITRDNFSQIMSLLVESKKFKEGTLWTPKQILFDFMKEFYSKVKEKKLYSEYISILWKNIFSRDIIIYSFENKEQQLLSELWIAWTIDYTEDLDFNYPVFTSVSWNKSDRYVKREFQKVVKTNPDCSIDTTLKVIQKHTFAKSHENILTNYIKKYDIPNKDEALKIQWKAPNKQYIRVLIPKEAEIVKNEDMIIESFKNTQSVNFYLTTDVKEVNSYVIQYRLQNKECTPYNYKLYKQPWIENYNIYLFDGKKTTQKIWIGEDFFYNTLTHK